MAKTRTPHKSPQEEVAILREHLLERTPVSTVCESHDVAPSVFYHWQKQFFEKGSAAFEATQARRLEQQCQKKIDALEAELRRKNEVIAEISQKSMSPFKNRTWGALTGRWGPLDTRDALHQAPRLVRAMRRLSLSFCLLGGDEGRSLYPLRRGERRRLSSTAVADPSPPTSSTAQPRPRTRRRSAGLDSPNRFDEEFLRPQSHQRPRWEQDFLKKSISGNSISR